MLLAGAAQFLSNQVTPNNTSVAIPIPAQMLADGISGAGLMISSVGAFYLGTSNDSATNGLLIPANTLIFIPCRFSSSPPYVFCATSDIVTYAWIL